MQAQPLPVNDFPEPIKLGDEFTLKGIKVVGPNQLIYNCKEGEETLFIASNIKSCFSFRSINAT